MYVMGRWFGLTEYDIEKCIAEKRVLSKTIKGCQIIFKEKRKLVQDSKLSNRFIVRQKL